MLFSSPIMMGDNNGGAGDAMGGAGAGAGAAGIGGPGAAGGGAFDEWGGQNPDIDPELAMALKISLEEERQRATVPEEKKDTNQPADAEMKPAEAGHVAVDDDDGDLYEEMEGNSDEEDDEAALLRALAMSKGPEEGVAEAQPEAK